MAECCDNCRFWYPWGQPQSERENYKHRLNESYRAGRTRIHFDNPDKGECRRRAPQRDEKALSALSDEYRGRWPTTLPNHWCGEYEAV